VVFEGVRGSNYYGDIAIDDVSMTNGPCPPPASCDFETDQCSFSNDIGDDDFDWIRSSGGTTTLGTGPTADHTVGTSQGKFKSNQVKSSFIAT
jgi:hypothetical protein